MSTLRTLLGIGIGVVVGRALYELINRRRMESRFYHTSFRNSILGQVGLPPTRPTQLDDTPPNLNAYHHPAS